jgi:hypothetical protein
LDEIYNAEVATVLGSILASSDTRGIRGAADEALLNKVQKKFKKITLFFLRMVGGGYRTVYSPT